MHAAWNESTIERMTEFWTEDGDWIWEDPPDLPDAQVLRGRDAVLNQSRKSQRAPIRCLFSAGGSPVSSRGFCPTQVHK